jgi:hypothetical protein
MNERGDAEPAGRDDLLLRRGQRPGAGRRFDRTGTERAGQLSEAIGDHVVPDRRLAGHVLLMGGDTATGRIGPDPEPDQLGKLLLQRHGRDQRLHPLRDRAVNVPPDWRVITGLHGPPDVVSRAVRHRSASALTVGVSKASKGEQLSDTSD